MRTLSLIMIVGGAQGAHMGAMNLLVPLYVLSLGLSMVWVGALVAAMAVFQILLQFAGGVLSDRFGERSVLVYAFIAGGVGSIAFAFLQTPLVLFAIQVLLGSARAVFNPASQSYASRISDSDRARTIGRFRGGANLGSAFGPMIGGVSAASGAFEIAFFATAAIAFAGLLATWQLPMLPRQQPGSIAEAIGPAARLARSRQFAFLGTYGFLFSNAMPVTYIALMVAFFKEAGLPTVTNGALASIWFLAAAATGFGFGRVLGMWGRLPLTAYAFGSAGAATLVMAVSGGNLLILVLLVLVLGVSLALMTSMRITLVAESSKPQERGVASGVVGSYSGLAALVMPAVLGVVAGSFGIETALVVSAVMSLSFAASVPLWMRWALRQDSAEEGDVVTARKP